MRCPQCGTRVEVDFPSIRVAGGDFMLLQLKCQSCAAFIVLHVNLTEKTVASTQQAQPMMNASSTLTLSDDDMKTLRSALQASDGSFEKLFSDFGKKA